jgi:hypothetical protein
MTTDQSVVMEFRHGFVCADSVLAWTYGTKHKNRFGGFIRERPATAADPQDEYRLTYWFKDDAPARLRYLERQHDKKHPGQSRLFPL